MRLNKRLKCLSIVVVLFASLLPLANAVDPPTPGAIQDTLKQRKQGFSQQAPEVTQQQATQKTKKVKSGGKKIKVNRFEITGNTLFTEATLHDLIAEQEGQALTLQEVYAVANILTKFYRDEGYSLASAAVPAQKVSSGTIRLQVSEGIVDKITFVGNESYSDDFLLKQLDTIAPGRPLRLDNLEREVLLLDGLPGFTARSLIKPGEEQGTASVEFKTEEKPYDGLILIDNAGSDAIGVWRITGSVTLNNPLGIGDALILGHTHTEHNLLRNYQFGYNFPILENGTRVSVDFSRANFEIGGEFGFLDIDGDSTNFRLAVSHPFIRNRKDNLLGAVAIVSQTSETRDGNGDRVGDFDPNLTFLEISAVASRVHEDQSFTSLTAAIASNFQRNQDGLENSALTGRLDADISHERAIFPNWSLFTRLVGELSIDAQMDLTQFGVGGPGSIRGFPTSEARGDYGYFVQVEARRFYQINEQFSGGFKAFIDHGEIYRKVVPAGFEDSESLTSYGIGANVTYLNNYNVDFQFARPFRHNGRGDGVEFVSDDKNFGRFWVTLSVGI